MGFSMHVFYFSKKMSGAGGATPDQAYVQSKKTN